MDFDRNSMTVPVQSSDYTNKFLQKDPSYDNVRDACGLSVVQLLA